MTSSAPTEGARREPLLLRCRRLVQRADIRPRDDMGVLVRDGRVVAVDSWSSLSPHHTGISRRTLDGVVIPGLVDAHSHLRGLSLSEQGVDDELLEGWLLRLRSLTALPAGAEALVALTDLVGTGVTSVQGVVHVFDAPDDYAALVDDVVRAVQAVGVRVHLMLGLTDQAEWAPPGDVPVELREFVDAPRGTAHRAFAALVREASSRYDELLVSVGVAPVAPQWCSDDLLASVRSLADDGLRLHSHLLESAWQREWLDEDPVTRLARWDLLGPFLSVAHGVWLTSEELGQLAALGVTPVHCPTSNAALKVGAAPVREWIDAGLVPALGLDSYEQQGQVDAFAEMRAAQATAASRDAALTAQEVLSMATVGGAGALGRAGELGCIQPGSSADLVLLDHPVAEITPEETVPVVVATGSRARVQSVYCAGSLVLEDGQGRTTPEAGEAREQLRQLLAEDANARAERQRDIAPAVDSLLSHLWQRATDRPESVTP